LVAYYFLLGNSSMICEQLAQCFEAAALQLATPSFLHMKPFHKFPLIYAIS